MKLVFILSLLSAFVVSGADHEAANTALGDRRIVVSYDPKAEHRPIVKLVQGGETMAELKGLGVDWTWVGTTYEKAIYGATWNSHGDLFWIHYQAGRILTGFNVYRVNADRTVTEIPIRDHIGALYKSGKVGKPPDNPNNSLIHAIHWLSQTTLLCDIHTADKGPMFVTIHIATDNTLKTTNIFELHEPPE